MITPPMVPAQSTPVNTGYSETALTYFDKGWAPLPMPKGKNAKSNPPVGFTGRNGEYPERQRVEFWASNFASNNLAIRVPRNVIGLDVDAYDNKPGGKTLAELEARCGELPTTWRSTSRTDGISGIYLFRAELPEDRKWQDQPAVEIVRWDHRYAMSYPSVHRTGRTYRWYYGDSVVDLLDLPTPEELPELPPEWLEALTVPRARVDHENVTDTDPRFTEGQPGTRYGLSALRSELTNLQVVWDRNEEAFNPQLNKCCFAVGQLVGGGELDEVHARVELENFMIENSVPADQYKTLESGFNKGMEQPRNSGEQKSKSSTGIWHPPGLPSKNARQFLSEFSGENGMYTLRRYRGTWIEWDGSKYTPRSSEYVQNRIGSRLEHAKFYAEENGQQVVKDWNPSPNSLSAVYEMVVRWAYTNDAAVSPAWIDDEGNPDESRPDPHEYIALANGLWHAPSQRLLPPTPNYFNTACSPFPYNPDAPKPERWLKLMDELWEHDPLQILTLQEWFGYCLTSRTNMQKALFLIGTRRSGKGTILRVLEQLLGEESYQPFSLKSLSMDFGLQDLIGKNFMAEGDMRIGRDDKHLNDSIPTLLKIVGEDSNPINVKYKSQAKQKLTTKVMVLSNGVPRFNDTSNAIAARILPLRTVKTFEGKEDTNLTTTLYRELPGILMWALEGYDRLIEQGQFTLSPLSEMLLNEMRAANSPISEFIRSECTLGKGLRESKKRLYERYTSWCLVTGISPISEISFSPKLIEAEATIFDPKKQMTMPDGTRHRYLENISLG